MTGDDIIAEARRNFGETTALTLTDPDFQRWVNTAQREVYSLLPLNEVDVLAETTTVTLTSGKGDLPPTLDRLLSVTVADVPAYPVPLETIQAFDASPYFTPYAPAFTQDGESIWARSAAGNPTSVTVTHVDPPAEITDFTAEVALPKWHAVIVLLVTALAYAQEEDKGQAQHYRNEALALVNRGQGATVPEQESA